MHRHRLAVRLRTSVAGTHDGAHLNPDLRHIACTYARSRRNVLAQAIPHMCLGAGPSSECDSIGSIAHLDLARSRTRNVDEENVICAQRVDFSLWFECHLAFICGNAGENERHRVRASIQSYCPPSVRMMSSINLTRSGAVLPPKPSSAIV
jgi:hypothetical protein